MTPDFGLVKDEIRQSNGYFMRPRAVRAAGTSCGGHVRGSPVLPRRSRQAKTGSTSQVMPPFDSGIARSPNMPQHGCSTSGRMQRHYKVGRLACWQRLDAASAEPGRCIEVLADPQDRDRIIGKAHDCRRCEAIREIPGNVPGGRALASG